MQGQRAQIGGDVEMNRTGVHDGKLKESMKSFLKSKESHTLSAERISHPRTLWDAPQPMFGGDEGNMGILMRNLLLNHMSSLLISQC